MIEGYPYFRKPTYVDDDIPGKACFWVFPEDSPTLVLRSLKPAICAVPQLTPRDWQHSASVVFSTAGMHMVR